MNLRLGHTLRSITGYFRSHQRLSVILLFFSTWLIASYIFFHRFPQNFLYPNFFAEDGQHFTANIIDKGFLGGLLTPFNGYFIFGIYILTGIGFVVNHALYQGQFADLPASLALVSYAFLGLCSALPILLLRSYIRLPYLLALSLLITLLPMPSFDYGTIGTIGNLKFPFVYICFLLVLYRVRLAQNAKRIFLVDGIIAIGLFTTAGCYIALPFIFASRNMLPQNLQNWKRRSTWFSLIRRNNYALWSFTGLILLGLIQIAYIAIHGTPDLSGYLDQPYQWSKTIEVFIARPYAYPYIASMYHHMRGIFILLGCLIAAILITRYSTNQNRFLYIFGITTIFSTTAIFIYNRTGVSFYYDHYQTSGFDNFYYTQNFISLVIGITLLTDLTRRWRTVTYIGTPLLVLLIAANMTYTNQTYAPNDFMHHQILPLKTQLSELCTRNDNQVTFQVYPFTFLTMKEPRSRACTTDVTESKPTIVNYGLVTKNDKILNISPGNPRFYQVFTAKANNLQALAIYVSTYYQSRLHGYQLDLLDAKCKQTIASVVLPQKVRDNSYITMPIKTSLITGSRYCFSVYPKNASAPQLALQFAQSINTDQVQLYTNGQVSDRNITFEAIY